MLFLKSIGKRGGRAKWISGRWMNINNGVKGEKSTLLPYLSLLDKNRNYEGIWSNKRKSFVKSVGMNGSNFKNETLFVSFTAIVRPYYPYWQYTDLFIYIMNIFIITVWCEIAKSLDIQQLLYNTFSGLGRLCWNIDYFKDALSFGVALALAKVRPQDAHFLCIVYTVYHCWCKLLDFALQLYDYLKDITLMH